MKRILTVLVSILLLSSSIFSAEILHEDVFRKPEKNHFYTIAKPGLYRLRADVIGSITIASNNVTLDLNGHTIFGYQDYDGIVVLGGSDIRVINGRIQGTSGIHSPRIRIESMANGISLAPNSHSVSVEQLIITRWKNGISAQNADGLMLTDLVCACNATGFIGQSSSHVTVQKCFFSNNNAAGFEIDNSAGITLNSCTLSDNGQDGLLAKGCTCVEIIECMADRNGNDGFEFLDSDTARAGCSTSACDSIDGAESLTGIFLSNCSAQCNSNTGFSADDSVLMSFLNCKAVGNLSGFSMQGCTSALLRACSAINNSNFGFFDDGMNCRNYFSNVACDNGVNFSPIISNAPVTSPANANGADNVDCSSSDVDQISLIQNIVEGTESILDVLASISDINISKVILIEIIVQENTSLLEQIFSISENIESVVEIIETVTDNTLDKVSIIESIVENISSVVDETASDIEVIRNVTDTTASLIENINTDTHTIQSDVQLIQSIVDANACCSTIQEIASVLETISAPLADIQSTVKHIDQVTSESLSIVENISSVVDKTDVTVNLIESTVTQENSQIQTINANTLQTLSLVEFTSATLDEMGQDLQEIESVVQRIESIVEDIESVKDTTLSVVEHLSSVVDELEAKVDAVQSSVESVSAVVSNINNNITAILSIVCEIETSIESINQNVLALESSVESIESIVEDIQVTDEKIFSLVVRLESIVESVESKISASDCAQNDLLIFSIVERIESIVQDIEKTGDETFTAVERIESIVENIQCAASACAPTVIPISVGNYTISAPGTYCLAQDLNGSIEITSNSVSLDLNGHTINQVGNGNGVTINGTLIDVRVRNGLLVGNLGFPMGTGVKMINGPARDIRIDDLTMINWLNGIDATDTNGLVIERVISNKNRDYGMRCIGCMNVEVRNSSFNENVQRGGIFIDGGQCIDFDNCTASNNNGAGVGFFMDGEHTAVRNCSAIGNVTGFFSVGGSIGPVNSFDIYYQNCVAQFNQRGFLIDITTGTPVVSNATVLRNCISHASRVNGIEDDQPVTVTFDRFYQNISANSTALNWFSFGEVFNAPVTGPSTAKTFYNIDGSLP